jgi:hypothetical protein
MYQLVAYRTEYPHKKIFSATYRVSDLDLLDAGDETEVEKLPR